MNEPLFRLDGETWDLEEMACSFQEGHATVKKSDDFFYLSLDELKSDSAKLEEEIRAAGENALNAMNAICLVRDERFRAPRIAGIARRDPVTGKIGGTSISLQGRVEIKVRARGTLTVTESDGTLRPRQPTLGERAFQICSANDALREALRTYTTVERNWSGLSNVLETIKKANKGKIQKTWATKREIKAFKVTAQNYSASGPWSRHGFDASKKGVKAEMTISLSRK
jgi:hypothetical protein